MTRWNRKIRILFLSDFYNPYFVGGAEKIIEKDAQFLTARGDFEVAVLTTRPFSGIISLLPLKRTIEGVTRYSFYPISPYFGVSNLQNVPNIVKFLKLALGIENPHSILVLKWVMNDFKPDIVHSNIIASLSYGVLRFIKVPLCHSFFDYYYECPKGLLYHSDKTNCDVPPLPCRLRNQYLKPAFQNVDRFIVLNKLQEYRLQELGYGERKVVRLPNSITMRTEPSPFEKRENIILYVGSLFANKGVEVLLEGFIQTAGNDNWDLVIVGKGDALESLRMQYRHPNIRILGFLPRETLIEYFSKSKLFVCPSTSRDVFPTVNLEAMSYGLPILGSNLYGIKEQVIDGYNGKLFTCNSSQDLALKLHEMISNPSLLAEMGQNSYELGKSRFDEGSRNQKLVEIYFDLLRTSKIK